MAPWKAAVRAALALLFVLLPLGNADQWFYDRFLRVRGIGLRSKSVTIATLPRGPEGSLVRSRGAHAVKTPWRQGFHGPLLEKILKCGPRAVVLLAPFDSVDANPAARPANRDFSRIPVFFAAGVGPDGRVIAPPMELLRGDTYGFAGLFPDADGRVRKFPLVHEEATSAALLLVEKVAGTPPEIDLLRPAYVDYRGPPGTYAAVNAESEQPLLDSALRNRVVLVGFSDAADIPGVDTPLGPMSRLEAQANAFDTLVENRTLTRAPEWTTYASSLLAVAGAIAIILLSPLTVSWLLLLLLASAELILGFILLSQGKIWIAVANPLLCIFSTHLLFLGQRLSAEEARRWRVEKESDALREMDRFKNNFLALFSHDLKTPLARINANIDRIQAENVDLNPSTKEAVSNIDRANRDLGRLISDILKLTKMETNRLQPSCEVIDLNGIAEESAKSLRYLADEKKIPLVLDLEPLFSMEGDGQLLREVVTNLVENAIKYSPSGKRVIVRTREEDGKVRVSVVDEGIGIPADELPFVATKFFRGKGVTATHRGTGLGLYLAKYFVELHGGGIELQSQVGRGTDVSFWLPLPN